MFEAIKNVGSTIRQKLMLAGGEDVYNDEYYEDYENYQDDMYEDDPMQEHYSRIPVGRKSSEKAAKVRYSDKIVELGYSHPSNPAPQGYSQSAMPTAVIAHPKDIKDACAICDDICSGKMVIVDLSGLDSANSQRIADYLGGVVHTLQGNTNRVNKGIFVISPREFEVVSSGSTEASSKEYSMYKVAATR